LIVECNSCQTRFQLDESRIPVQGIRVRCSRCKEAFFLKHPSASESEVVDQIAEEAASEVPTSAPGSTQDLTVESQKPAPEPSPPVTSPDLPAEADGASSSGSESEEGEESWEFIGDLPDGEVGGDSLEEDLISTEAPDSPVEASEPGVASSNAGTVFNVEDFDDEPQAEKVADGEDDSGEFDASDLSDPNESEAAPDESVAAPDESEADSDESVAVGAAAEATADTRESAFGSVDDFSALADEEPEVAETPNDAAVGEVTASPAPLTSEGGEQGDSEDWDFFSDESLEGTGTVAGGSAVTPAQDSASSSQMASAGSMGPGLKGCSDGVLTGSEVDAPVRRAGRAVGWAATLGLLAVGIARGLLPGLHPGASVPTAVELGDFRAEAVRGHWVETSRAGVLYTVTGRLRNTTQRVATPGAKLQVILLGADGERLETHSPVAGAPLREADLRELPPGRMRAVQDQSAWALSVASIAPGDAAPFLAYFDEVPEEAARFLLELQAPGSLSAGEPPEPRSALATDLRSSLDASSQEVRERRGDEEVLAPVAEAMSPGRPR
jgi:predicted Zn finger-like uncharacterized protein